MADIDELLKGSFDRLAEPADSTGVADLLRARVAAGDTGTSVDGTTAPGWGGAGAAARPAWFWPLLATVGGLVVILSILIGTLVVGGTPQPTTEPTPVETPTVTPTPTPTVTETPTPTPTPTVSDDPEPPPPPPPPPPPVDNAPTIQQISANPTAVACENGSMISVVASDDKAVTRVDISWNGPSTGSGTMTLGGGTWTYFIPMNSGTGTYTITAVARDGGGNSSAPASIGVLRDICIT